MVRVGKFEEFLNYGEVRKKHLSAFQYFVFRVHKALKSANVVVHNTGQHVLNARFSHALPSGECVDHGENVCPFKHLALSVVVFSVTFLQNCRCIFSLDIFIKTHEEFDKFSVFSDANGAPRE